MARLEPFRGTTYVPGKVNPDDVIAPPYDVVDAAGRSHLAALSPYNAIHVELPVAAPGADPYEHAAHLFAKWHDEGAVAVAAEPTFYVYRMTFGDEDGKRRSTTGVLGALGLDPTHEGSVLPHEQTIPKDKHDRLSLLRASRTNFSPIWGLSLAPGVSDACIGAIAAAPGGEASPWTATDDEGVVHETWPVSDPQAVARISGAVAAAPVLIADGHHRYETACAYYEETSASPGSGAVLAFVVELAPEQLSVRAIHRLLSGIDATRLPSLLGELFVVEAVEDCDLDSLQAAMADREALGLLTAQGMWTLRPNDELLARTDDDLDSSRLAYALAHLGIEQVRYQHGAAQVAEAVRHGEASAAVLLQPVSIAQIARTAHGGRRMPPKSTFFHPKLRTGMAFRELNPPA